MGKMVLLHNIYPANRFETGAPDMYAVGDDLRAHGFRKKNARHPVELPIPIPPHLRACRGRTEVVRRDQDLHSRQSSRQDPESCRLDGQLRQPQPSESRQCPATLLSRARRRRRGSPETTAITTGLPMPRPVVVRHHRHLEQTSSSLVWLRSFCSLRVVAVHQQKPQMVRWR